MIIVNEKQAKIIEAVFKKMRNTARATMIERIGFASRCWKNKVMLHCLECGAAIFEMNDKTEAFLDFSKSSPLKPLCVCGVELLKHKVFRPGITKNPISRDATIELIHKTAEYYDLELVSLIESMYWPDASVPFDELPPGVIRFIYWAWKLISENKFYFYNL